MAVALMRLKALTVIVLALLLAGCSKKWAITLCNRSGTDMAIPIADRKVAWSEGTCVRLVDEVAQLSWVERARGGAEVPILRVLSPTQELDYSLDLFPLPALYVTPTGGIDVVLQLESDDKLYLVPPNEPLPTSHLPQQPPRFPIDPTRSEPR
jgi:hypothetical protein